MTKRRTGSSPNVVSGLASLVIFFLIYAPEYLRYRFLDNPATRSLGWIAMGVNLALLLVVIFIVGLINSTYKKRRLMTVVNLQTLTPSDFEYYVAAVFEAQGFRTSVTGRTGDGGVDINLERDGKKAIVQCKRYRKSVGVNEIREFSDVANRADAQRAFFVTTSEFTAGAIDWARDNPKIKLIDNHRLFTMLQDLKIGPFAEGKVNPGLYIGRWQLLGLMLMTLCANCSCFMSAIYVVNQSRTGG